jgi:hypothetical protein
MCWVMPNGRLRQRTRQPNLPFYYGFNLSLPPSSFSLKKNHVRFADFTFVPLKYPKRESLRVILYER